MIEIIIGISFVVAVLAFRWPRHVLWGLLIFLPFQIALNPFDSIDLLAGRLIVPAIFIGWILMLWKQRIPLTFSPLLWISLSLASFGTLSSLWAIDGLRAFQTSLLWWSFIPIVPLYEWLFSFKKERQYFLFVATMLVGLVSVTALFPLVVGVVGGIDSAEAMLRTVSSAVWGNGLGNAVITHPSWFVDIGGVSVLRAFFPFPDPHMLAFFIAALLPFVALRRSKVDRFVFMGGVIVLLLTFSRGGYLGALVALGMGAILFWTQSSHRMRQAAFSIAAIVLLFLIIPNSFAGRFWSSFDLSEGSIVGRTETMREAVSVILRYPWTGVGLGNYARTVVPLAGADAPIYAHSSYLDIAAQMGLIVFGSLLVAGIGLFRTRIKTIKRDTISLMSLVSITWIAVHALFETPLFSPRVLPFLIIVMIIVLANPHEASIS